MYSALYYPHTSLGNNLEFAKTALLLWDEVDYISPFGGYRPRYENPVLAEAAEILTVGHVPSEDEKHKAHVEIERLVNADLPEWFVFNPEGPNPMHNLDYEVMPEKLLPETWKMLLASEWVREGTTLSPSEEHGHYLVAAKDYVLNTSLGLTIMSILADICAGEEKETVTDESENYAALTRYFAECSEGSYNISLASDVAPEAEQLVTISLNTLSGQAASLNELVELRKREENARTPFLRELRSKYFGEVNKYITRLQDLKKEDDEAKNKERDKAEIERQFKKAMEADLKNLQQELRLESWQLLFRKEMLGAVAFAAGTVVEPFTTTTISTALLGKALINHRENKRSTYKGHAMSWLYQTHPSRIYG
jgi:hypothetical protein